MGCISGARAPFNPKSTIRKVRGAPAEWDQSWPVKPAPAARRFDSSRPHQSRNGGRNVTSGKAWRSGEFHKLASVVRFHGSLPKDSAASPNGRAPASHAGNEGSIPSAATRRNGCPLGSTGERHPDTVEAEVQLLQWAPAGEKRIETGGASGQAWESSNSERLHPRKYSDAWPSAAAIALWRNLADARVSEARVHTDVRVRIPPGRPTWGSGGRAGRGFGPAC